MNFKTDVIFRKRVLTELLHHVTTREDEIIAALHQDFKKPALEGMLTETFIVIQTLKHTIAHLHRWAKPQRVWPSILNFPSRDTIYPQPYGSVLVIAPWNYPFQLALNPLIAAVAAGNSVTLKPSEQTPHTAAIVAEIVRAAFSPNHVEVYQGGPEVSQKLLTHRWDYIFFTGSVTVGKLVAQAAAVHLTPVTLELGGKNPCIVDASGNLTLAARRIVWGKFLNAGQTCIAPDYILVHAEAKHELVRLLIDEIRKAYGQNPFQSPDLARIVNTSHWNRLCNLLKEATIIHGGENDRDELYIAPTLIDEPPLDSALMQEEIFGPLLPIITYRTFDEIAQIISRYENPLAFYIFSDMALAKKTINQFSFGGGCINDTVVHFGNVRLPFGGVGHSGMGAYHGKYGFDTFSHKKAIVHKANWLDLPMRYAPYGNKFNTLRKLLKWL